MSGYTRTPRCSSGTRSAHNPRLPPTIDGDADRSSACLPLNGCGLNRDTQSITFFDAALQRLGTRGKTFGLSVLAVGGTVEIAHGGDVDCAAMRLDRRPRHARESRVQRPR